MILAGSKQLDGMLRDGSFPRLLLLWGEDGPAVQKYQHRLEKAVVTAFPDFNSYRCDGKAPIDLDALGDSALALPVMAPRRFALVDDLNADLLSAGDMAKLQQLAEELPEETLLVITMRSALPDLKKKGSKGAKVHALCDRHGGACCFQRPTASAAAQLAAAEAARLGSSLGREEGLLLASYCGRDSQRMLVETQKLAAHSPDGITAEDIRRLVAPVTEARVFDLSDRMIARDYTAAMATINDLIFQRESPVTILTILSMAFVDMYRAAVARKQGIPDAAAKKAYGYGGSGYRYDKGVQNQRRFSLPMLEDILELLARADGRMKASGIDPRVVLETLVADIFRRMEAG